MNENYNTAVDEREYPSTPPPSWLGTMVFVGILMTFISPLFLFFYNGNERKTIPIADDKQKPGYQALETSLVISATNTGLSLNMGLTNNRLEPDGLTALSNNNSKVNTKISNGSDRNQSASPIDIAANSGNNWRCACKGGFLPPGLLQTMGGAEAVFRMSSGECYHKQS